MNEAESGTMIVGPRVWVFFYGTFMHPEVLVEHGVAAGETVPAKVGGFELLIRPRVNLQVSDSSCVFGALVAMTHDDLAKIYAGLYEQYGLTYLPQAVIAETLDGMLRTALCYITPHMPTAPPDLGYVEQLAACVRSLGLPEWYALHVESFRSTAN